MAVEQAKDWLVALLPARWVPSQRQYGSAITQARDERLRRHAQRIDSLEEVLDRDRNELKRKKNLVVFVPGLMSVDVGTFDRLLMKLEPHREQLMLAGFPHDTLQPIASNGHALARLLKAVLRQEEHRIVSVAHSSGGLVVRQAATELYQDCPDQAERLRGCVTFGTPHTGTSLATAPQKLIEWIVVGMGHCQTVGTIGIRPLLDYCEGNRVYRGVRDLLPIGAPGTEKDCFLRTLEAAEEAHPRKLRLYAVGGDMGGERPSDRVLERLGTNGALRLHDEPGHDWIVERSSSLPPDWPPEQKEQVGCHHFGYFTPAQDRTLDQVVRKLLDWLSEDQAPNQA
jgi:hypothetical protein